MEESAVLDMLAKRCETRDDQLADLLAMPAFEEFVHEADAAGFAEAKEQEEKQDRPAAELCRTGAEAPSHADDCGREEEAGRGLAHRFGSAVRRGVPRRCPDEGAGGRDRGGGETWEQG